MKWKRAIVSCVSIRTTSFTLHVNWRNVAMKLPSSTVLCLQVTFIFHFHQLEHCQHSIEGTKLLQAQRFNEPTDRCKILVATDAIGMGLNLYVFHQLVSLCAFCLVSFFLFERSIKRIIFYSLVKAQINEQGGKEKDLVTTSQALQIAGRAGRSN